MEIVDIKNADAVTHAGVFHADDVMAAAVLDCACGGKLRLARVKQAGDIPEGFKGTVFDIGEGPLDHHQAGGAGARPDGTPYASAGLVWRRYGGKLMAAAGTPNPSRGMKRLDAKLMAPIDANDNGLRIKEREYALWRAINAMNPAWNEKERGRDEAFVEAAALAAAALRRAIAREKARQEAEDELVEKTRRAEGSVLVLDPWIPWEDAAAEGAMFEGINFVVYPSERGGWGLQCVPKPGDPMSQKIPIPGTLRGLPEKEYALIGLPGIRFVHNRGYFAAADTKEAALTLAGKIEREKH